MSGRVTVASTSKLLANRALKRIAWAYGCEERKLYALLVERVEVA